MSKLTPIQLLKLREAVNDLVDRSPQDRVDETRLIGVSETLGHDTVYLVWVCRKGKQIGYAHTSIEQVVEAAHYREYTTLASEVAVELEAIASELGLQCPMLDLPRREVL